MPTTVLAEPSLLQPEHATSFSTIESTAHFKRPPHMRPDGFAGLIPLLTQVVDQPEIRDVVHPQVSPEIFLKHRCPSLTVSTPAASAKYSEREPQAHSHNSACPCHVLRRVVFQSTSCTHFSMKCRQTAAALLAVRRWEPIWSISPIALLPPHGTGKRSTPITLVASL